MPNTQRMLFFTAQTTTCIGSNTVNRNIYTIQIHYTVQTERFEKIRKVSNATKKVCLFFDATEFIPHKWGKIGSENKMFIDPE